MSKLLLDKESIIMFSKDLACIKEIGLNGAIVLQQIHYWIEHNKTEFFKDNDKYLDKYQDDRFWTYNTLEDWHTESFGFWSLKTLQRTIDKLVDLGFIIKGNYNKKRYDRTVWYTINYEKLEEYEDNLKEIEIKRMKKQIERVKTKKEKQAIRDKKFQDNQLSKSEYNAFRQNDQTHLDNLSNAFRQNDQTHLDKMTKPIPNNTTENTTNNTTNNTTLYQYQDTCSTNNDILISSNQVEIIENNTHLKLSKNQISKVLLWDIIRLKESIEIFKEKQGKYFALLEKIYKDNGNFVPKNDKTYNTHKQNNFANFTQREYDYGKLEKQLLGWDDSENDDECEIDTKRL